MLTQGLPPAVTFGTWLESIELTSVDDNSYVDVSAATEIKLSLISDVINTDAISELDLKLSTGDITLPSPGIIQWRAEKEQMGTLSVRTYEVRMTIDINGDTMVLMLGTLDILR